MPEPKPWKRLRERHQRDYTIFTTRTFDVADPRDGAEYVRTVIDGSDWVNVVALTTDDQLVLVRQFRFGTWANSLEIPGGLVDPGEDAATAARRELEEETGFVPEKLDLIGTCHPNPAIQTNRLHTYRATNCRRVHDGEQDGSEDIEVVLEPRSSLGQLVMSGRITHALVLAAVLFETLRR